MDISLVVSEPIRKLHWGPLTVDLDREVLTVAGQVVAATPSEFHVVATLVARRNLPMTKEAIGTAIFGEDHGRDVRQIDMFVARLRRSLAAVGLPNAILTVPGRGYVMVDNPSTVVTPDQFVADEKLPMVA